MPPRKLDMSNATLLTRGAMRAASLFGVDEQRSLREVPLDAISANPDQPRTVFDEAGLQALAASIAKHGLIQPVCVQEIQPNIFRLVAGERRLRAFRSLDRDTIPAYVVPPDADPAELALIENVQRVDLDAVDLALGLQRLMETHGYLMEAAGAVIGVDASEVSRRLSVLRLPVDILREYQTMGDTISRSALYELATLDDPEAMRALWDRVKEGLSVRELRAAKKGSLTSASSVSDRPLTARALGKSLTKINGELDRLKAGRELFSDEHRTHLRTLRDHIDDLLGE